MSASVRKASTFLRSASDTCGSVVCRGEYVPGIGDAQLFISNRRIFARMPNTATRPRKTRQKDSILAALQEPAFHQHPVEADRNKPLGPACRCG